MLYETHTHPFAPVMDGECCYLILGSFPSVKSRENAFYYGHPQNRFWRVLAAIYQESLPQTIAEKRAFLLHHHIALWDVIAQCDIVGSGDNSIRNAVANDLGRVLLYAPVKRILLNGQTAGRLFEKHCRELCVPYDILPSTSPANARWTVDALVQAWSEKLKGE